MINMLVAEFAYALRVDYVHAMKVGLLTGGITLLYYIISDIVKKKKK